MVVLCSIIILLAHYFYIVLLDLVEAKLRTYRLVVLHILLIVIGRRPLVLWGRVEDECLLDCKVL